MSWNHHLVDVEFVEEIVASETHYVLRITRITPSLEQCAGTFHDRAQQKRQQPGLENPDFPYVWLKDRRELIVAWSPNEGLTQAKAPDSKTFWLQTKLDSSILL